MPPGFFNAMKKEQWKKRIIKATKDAGTYKPFFDDVINTLASIMEIRDITEQEYINSGAEPVIKYTNKGGSENVVKNPILVLIGDLNKDALAYWRDLGLTPAGYKKINEKTAGVTIKTLDDI